MIAKFVAVFALLASAGHVMAQGKPAPNAPFVLWLKGIYQSAVNAPDLRLPGINQNDGSWIVTEIHSVTTVPGSTNQSDAVVGHFYSQTTSALVAYDLPGARFSWRSPGGAALTMAGETQSLADKVAIITKRPGN